ncbi:hypothetical protein GCM10022419_069540 [Nonomuraea rosea]|uniref:Ig-like domain-containing protein n=1 Tax=Nonomuraea rosea TaxID=638574 RepID=A0ABP6Y6R6_9ACTN
MMSTGLARKAAAFGASAAVLAALAAGLVASPAQAATATTAKTATTATAKGAKVYVSTPKASTGDYEGSCPVKVNFSAKIKVAAKGKTELAYRWLHGDGSKGKVKVVKLKGTKSVTVKQSVTFKEDVKGWEAVQVLGPKKVTSKKGYFSVSCGKQQEDVRTNWDLSVSARAWASPSSYAGPCTPGDKIDFVGLIETNRPTWVRYRWVLNGDVVDYGRVKVRDARKVGFGFSPRHSDRGWAQLEILGPDSGSSNRAYYKVWCKDTAPEAPAVKISAATSVATTTDCKVTASGTVTSTGAGKVRWTWTLNGTSVGSGETYFGRHGGTKSIDAISAALTGEAAKGGTVSLSVTGPDNSETVTKSYSACQSPSPSPSPTPTESPKAS